MDSADFAQDYAESIHRRQSELARNPVLWRGRLFNTNSLNRRSKLWSSGKEPAAGTLQQISKRRISTYHGRHKSAVGCRFGLSEPVSTKGVLRPPKSWCEATDAGSSTTQGQACACGARLWGSGTGRRLYCMVWKGYRSGAGQAAVCQTQGAHEIFSLCASRWFGSVGALSTFSSTSEETAVQGVGGDGSGTECNHQSQPYLRSQQDYAVHNGWRTEPTQSVGTQTRYEHGRVLIRRW